MTTEELESLSHPRNVWLNFKAVKISHHTLDKAWISFTIAQIMLQDFGGGVNKKYLPHDKVLPKSIDLWLHYHPDLLARQRYKSFWSRVKLSAVDLTFLTWKVWTISTQCTMQVGISLATEKSIALIDISKPVREQVKTVLKKISAH